MTYILLISLIFITGVVAIFMMFARQSAIDYFVSLTHFFTLFVLVSHYLELTQRVSFNGSLVIVFGLIFVVSIFTSVVIRFKHYKKTGNSNIEG
ncbi:hypothetical protein BIY24_00170 [Halobacteriovorax marinus]|uniref:Integral membrane protein n=1 Tax=Halobacteriovorax marinus (strain ATCC BAA-682 / DSM 15412 / SJ) TaxID=862908 RepID=E1X1Q7_HALMS|nr:hypothetical protein [Halobacteriovorax marinus]ATH06413.1 hypothetical protein BIY24_00170 [Halobacteriovorax marinus]CBW24976.1 putative integral membrane protein [Halobacteriovorax marinus SJ]